MKRIRERENRHKSGTWGIRQLVCLVVQRGYPGDAIQLILRRDRMACIVEVMFERRLSGSHTICVYIGPSTNKFSFSGGDLISNY
ncbi:hypothetical protein EYR41_010526 [Orbilia oligospora]|uniref:Uncharacterized protein n=1 Tax=Orbilia oligospora TaxID=2813651 RepID=A0A8H2DRT8_ORBOL|nr:hypothetical protein EYR41_010526 [Orbilia oligospora]